MTIPITLIEKGFPMFDIIKDPSFAARGIPFGAAEVRFPARESWDEAAFRALARKELANCRARFADYDRKTVFSENPYFRFFRKFKKTYPVMQQFESVLFKGRPFPEGNPAATLPFLAEICTQVLSGAHDIDCIDGPLTIFTPDSRLPFDGMRAESTHTYPNDVCGRDGSGIIFSMIAGADKRTCVHPDSRHIFYPVFGTPDTPPALIWSTLDRIVSYVQVLAPAAEIETALL